MLTLNCLSSGSIGNCYLLSDEQGRVLILDMGVPVKRVKEALNFDLSKIVGAIATHEHQDHFSQYKEFVKMGCETFAPHLNGKVRENIVLYPYGIQAFLLPHADTVSYGFLIRHAETNETLLYATDFEYIRYTFGNCKVNHYLIECNYQAEYVEANIANLEHKIKGHCSLRTCEAFVKANANVYMKNIILCHLGISSTSPTECVDTVKKIVEDSVNVDYARANTIYQLN